MTQYHKKYMVIILMCFFILLVSIEANATNFVIVEKNICVIKGSTRMVEMETTSVNDKKISNIQIVSVNIKDFCVQIKGREQGETTVTFTIPEIEKRYKININVLSKSETNKKAKKELKKYLKKIEKGTYYAYVDFNKDGITELILKNKIVYYNYETGKIATFKHNFSTIYTCKKNQKIYVVLKKQRKTKEFIYFSEFYRPSYYEVFSLDGTGRGFCKYTEKGKKLYGVNDDYAYYDSSYDQDDYEYLAFDKNVLRHKLMKKLPGYKKVKWKKK